MLLSRHTRRRDVVTLAAGATIWPFARPFAAEVERRVGALLISPNNQSGLDAFREGLATFGWVEGRNLRIDYRFSDDLSRLAADAEELVNLRPDVIFAFAGSAALAVQQRTSIIPIVFAGGGDPTSNGLVRNIARPEGNITGFANYFGSLGGKWLELFKEAVPRLTRVAHVFPANAFAAGDELLRPSIAAAAAQLGVTIVRIPVRNAVEIEPAISAFAAEPDGGLLVTGDGGLLVTSVPVANPFAMFEAIGRRALYYHLPYMSRGVAYPAEYQLPLVYGGVANPAEGNLIAHGSDILDLARRASSYVDRILRGAKPSDLPVQYPTKFELVVNLKTAKAIGVTIPEAFLARADLVIE
jgi:putative ABC transport system substrate-binding protein